MSLKLYVHGFANTYISPTDVITPE
ncbi:Protein of unknown function [Gryllus bimaculatus]|nr:Protein of unknown function [Gryllus bimaculatus]